LASLLARPNVCLITLGTHFTQLSAGCHLSSFCGNSSSSNGSNSLYLPLSRRQHAACNMRGSSNIDRLRQRDVFFAAEINVAKVCQRMATAANCPLYFQPHHPKFLTFLFWPEAPVVSTAIKLYFIAYSGCCSRPYYK